MQIHWEAQCLKTKWDWSIRFESLCSKGGRDSERGFGLQVPRGGRIESSRLADSHCEGPYSAGIAGAPVAGAPAAGPGSAEDQVVVLDLNAQNVQNDAKLLM
jgi:hypothetical protein